MCVYGRVLAEPQAQIQRPCMVTTQWPGFCVIFKKCAIYLNVRVCKKRIHNAKLRHLPQPPKFLFKMCHFQNRNPPPARKENLAKEELFSQ